MANQEQLELLKQGVEQWNEWRRHSERVPDLSNADLRGANLSGAWLHNVDLSDSDLRDADLSDAALNGVILTYGDVTAAMLTGANLRGARLHKTDLSNIDLNKTDLRNAHLYESSLANAHLVGADLSGADLRRTDLSHAWMSGARLCGADLSHALLSRAHLKDTDLSGAIVWETVFADVDLREVQGLTSLHHQGPSRVELQTVQLPQDGSALHFLRGAGVSDEWIDFYRATMMRPIAYHSCFLSYSSQDELLARRLHADLQAQGVRCWFAPDDLKIGEKFRARIDEAIHMHEKLLLILSASAVESTWVEQEVEAAFEKEAREKRLVLFPIRIDDRVLSTSQAWAGSLRRTRHIGDFTQWAEPQAYEQAFERLLRDLKKAES